jgi:hypothetical protein
MRTHRPRCELRRVAAERCRRRIPRQPARRRLIQPLPAGPCGLTTLRSSGTPASNTLPTRYHGTSRPARPGPRAGPARVSRPTAPRVGGPPARTFSGPAMVNLSAGPKSSGTHDVPGGSASPAGPRVLDRQSPQCSPTQTQISACGWCRRCRDRGLGRSAGADRLRTATVLPRRRTIKENRRKSIERERIGALGVLARRGPRTERGR